jgi:hypothetical protein
MWLAELPAPRNLIGGTPRLKEAVWKRNGSRKQLIDRWCFFDLWPCHTHTRILTIFFHMTLTTVEGISLVSSKSLLLTQKINYKIFEIWSRIWIPRPRLPLVKLYKISLVSSKSLFLTQKIKYKIFEIWSRIRIPHPDYLWSNFIKHR